eukprot:386051_1
MASVNKKWRDSILWDGFEGDWEHSKKWATAVEAGTDATGPMNAWTGTCVSYWFLFGIFILAGGLVTLAEPRGWLFIGFSAFIMPIFLITFASLGYCNKHFGLLPWGSFFGFFLMIWMNFLAFWALSYGTDVQALLKDTNQLSIKVAERDLSYLNSSGTLSCNNVWNPKAMVKFEDMDNWQVTDTWSANGNS